MKEEMRASAARVHQGKERPRPGKQALRDEDLAVYQDWLTSLKVRVRLAQIRTVVSANTELVLLYWQIGRDILERQAQQGWGAMVVSRLATDLQHEFPEMKGFSPRNLKYMRAFSEAWPDSQIVQQLVAQLPWGHNIRLLDCLATPAERIWYAEAAIEHGWSRNVLVHQIETRAMDRQGATLTNFRSTLPEPQSDLAQQLVKDPYVFDFLTLTAGAKERELEEGLITHLQSFLLELGKGFAFLGRQYPLSVGNQDYYLDLLFYNTKLHCYVVIELKIDDFKPEHVGKMQFYLTAVDAQLKSERDAPSIGLILCKSKNGIIVEYALRDSPKPIGVAAYRILPPEMAEAMPTIEQLEAELREGVSRQAHPL